VAPAAGTRVAHIAQAAAALRLLPRRGDQSGGSPSGFEIKQDRVDHGRLHALPAVRLPA
jgi:hypothetical protein